MSKNIRQVLAFYRLLDPWRLALILIGALLVSAPEVLQLVVPLLVREAIDTLAQTRTLNLAALYKLGAVFAAALVLTYVGDLIYLRNKFAAASDLRNRIFEQSFFLPVQRLRERGSAYFATLINNHLNDAFIVLDYGYLRNLVMLARGVGILAIVFTWDRSFFLLFFLNVLGVIAYSWVIDRATRHRYSRVLELARRGTAYIVETFDHIHEVLAGRAVEKRCQRYRQMTAEIKDTVIKAESYRATLDKAMVELPEYVSRLVILAYGGFLVVNGRLTIGTLWALWAYFSYLIGPLYVFRDLARVAVQSAATIEAVLNYFAETSQAKEVSTKRTLVPRHDGPVFEVCRLTFSFPGAEPLLKEVSFTVPRGKIVAIVGLSGEGKSTLLNILLGFEQRYEGEVKFMGNELRGVSPSLIFEHLGYYSQTVGIFNDTLENNIVLGRPLDAKRLEEVISILGLGHLRGRLLGEGGSFISGGEKHRVQLARLFYGDYKVVVIDEPLTNLDLISEQFLLDKLAEFLTGRSGIIVSHKPNVLRLATEVVVLDKGRVIAVGTLRDLVRSDPLCRQIIHTYVDDALQLSREIGEL